MDQEAGREVIPIAPTAFNDNAFRTATLCGDNRINEPSCADILPCRYIEDDGFRLVFEAEKREPMMGPLNPSSIQLDDGIATTEPGSLI